MLKRIDKFDSRFYYETDKERYYLSATSFCSKVLKEDSLAKWKATVGLREARIYATERATYGTLLHEIIDRWLRGPITWSLINDMVDFSIEEHRYYHLRKQWHEDIISDVLSFQQFAHDKNLIADQTEVMGYLNVDDEFGLAGTIDFIGTIDYYGKPRQVIIDWKSGRDGFYDSHALQLHIYKEFLQEGEDYLLFNWSPKSWRGSKPTYNFKNQSDHPIGAALPHLIEFAKTQNMFTLNHREIAPKNDDLILGQEPSFDILDIHQSLKTA